MLLPTSPPVKPISSDAGPDGADLNGPVPDIAAPRLTNTIHFADFLTLAREQPHLHARNTAGFLRQAIRALGVHPEYCYGRTIDVPNFLANPSLIVSRRIERMPHDHEETFARIDRFLAEQELLPRPDKGILFFGDPGAGKNLIVDILLKVAESYSRYAAEGVRFRLALEWQSNIVGFRGNGRSRENGSGGLGGNGKSFENTDQEPVYKASVANVTPFALINQEYDIVLEMTGSRALAEQASGREALVKELRGRAADLGRVLNEEYILNAEMGPDLANDHYSLVRFQMMQQKLSPVDAVRFVREHNVFAQPYRFNPPIGQGILEKLPEADRHSDAVPMGGYSTGRRVPAELQEGLLEPIAPESAYLQADIFHFEDFLHGLDARSTVFFNAFIERGALQIESSDSYEARVAHHTTRYYTYSGKDALVFASTNSVDLRARRDSPGFDSLMERFHAVLVPHIRNYHKQASAMDNSLRAFATTSEERLLPGARVVTPHARELAAAFFVATRLITPKAEHYTDEFAPVVKVLPLISDAVAKALYLGSSPESREERLLTLLREDRISPDDLKLLNDAQVRERIAHEYSGEESDLSDGGFGISPRKVHDIMTSIVNFNPGKDLTVRDVIGALKAFEGNFAYYRGLRQAQNALRQKIYGALCESSGLDAIEPGSIESAPGLSRGDRETLLKYWQQAARTVKERYPISEPAEIVASIEKWGKGLVARDIRIGLKLTDEKVEERLLRYIMHLRTECVRGFELPEEFWNSKKEYAAGATTGVDSVFMESVESDMGFVKGKFVDDSGKSMDRDSWRRLVWGKFGAAATRLREDPELATVSITDLFKMIIRDDATGKDFADRLAAKRDKDAKPKVRAFLANTGIYFGQEGRLTADLNDKTKDQDARDWSDAWQSLRDRGYTDAVLPALISWSLDESKLKA